MIYTFSEAELIQSIQNEAPVGALFLQNAGVLTPQKGREQIEDILWRAEELSVYSSLARGIANAILEWKKNCHESLPAILNIWISYDSKLYDLNWQEPLRVTVKNNGKIESYHWSKSAQEISQHSRAAVRRGSGPVEAWFRILSDAPFGNTEFPTIHTYLSHNPEHTKSGQGINAITFYDNKSSSEARREKEERHILARSSQGDHLYIGFSSIRPDRMIESMGPLVDGTIELAKELFTEERMSSLWLRRYALFLRNTIMRAREEIKAPDDSISGFQVDNDILEQAQRALKTERDLRGPKENGETSNIPSDSLYDAMTNIRIFVPGEEPTFNLGSITIFSDRLLGSRLTRIIASAVWPIFLILRQREDDAIARAVFRSHALRSAVAAIMGRNMSHNIGSHVLAYLSSEGAKEDLWIRRSIKENETTTRRSRNLNIYLRERMDFIAAVSTLDPTWVVPLDILSEMIEPIWAAVDRRYPELFLVLDNIARSEGIRAAGMELHISIVENEGREEFQYGYYIGGDGKPLYQRRPEVRRGPHKLAIYLGIAGLQAFYVILENFIRNSAKHSLEKESARKRSQAIVRLFSGSNAEEDREIAVNNEPLKIFLTFEFDWSTDSYEDYVKVSIYDNMGGWGDNGRTIEKDISPKLDPAKSTGSLITDQGQLSEGAWGLKEMRICASFLRGLKIQNYDNPRPEGQRGKTVPVLRAREFPCRGIPDQKSLGYVFYIPKAKDLLIIGNLLPRYAKRNSLKNQGIYWLNKATELESLQDRGTFTHKFVVIDADDLSNLEHFLNNIKQYPIRTFLVTSEKECVEAEIKRAKEVKLCRPFLKHIITRDQFNAWLASPNLTLSVYGRPTVDLDDLQERLLLNMFHRWLEVLNSSQDMPKVGVGYYEFEADAYEDEISFGFFSTGEGTETELVKDSVILSHRHDGFRIDKDTIKDDAIRSCRFYAPYTTAESNQLRMYAESLTNRSSNIGSKVRPYFELLEASLANLIVIDERVFDDARRRRSFPGLEMHLFSYLYLQNILVLNLVRENLAEDREVEVQYYDLPKPFRASADLPNASSTDLNGLQKMMRTVFPEFQKKIHFLIIHQTIIDKLNGGKGMDQLLAALGAYQPAWVVVTSGRGRPEREKLPSFARFLEFSNLRKYLVEKPDKVLLMQMLYSLKSA